MRLSADVAVVGSGAGGAAVAARLSEAGQDVVLLEAGPRVETSDMNGEEGDMIPRLMRSDVSHSGLAVYAGACVGGSTVVNDALCFRTPPDVLASWRDDHGLTGLHDDAFARYVEEAWLDVHATATDRAHTNRNAHHLEVGAQRLGWSAEATPRSVRGCVNLGLCNFGCPSGAKQSTLLTYVPRAERAGARVLPLVQAERVRLEAGQVRGIEARRLDSETRQPRESVTIEAPTVCLAAGVLATPRLLAASGLGVDGPGVQFHSTLQVTARFPEPVHAYYGPTMAMAISEFAASGLLIESVAAHPFTTAQSLPGFGPDLAAAMDALPFLARGLVLLRDRSRGRFDPALRYALEADDWERIRQGLRAAARAYLAAGAVEVHVPVHGLGPLHKDTDLAALDRAPLGPGRVANLYAVHLFGGASMGRDAAAGFCDERGASFAARGLWICDASALPSNTGVNPQITILANALRVADEVRADA
jgi:choline dehydrogenase-like flavoprotein